MGASLYQPLSDRVLLKPKEAESTTKSGIFIPDTAKEKPQEGEVVAVGSGRVTDDGKTIPVSVKKGDIVLYAKYGGTEIKVDGQEYLIVRDSDILAVRG